MASALTPGRSGGSEGTVHPIGEDSAAADAASVRQIDDAQHLLRCSRECSPISIGRTDVRPSVHHYPLIEIVWPVEAVAGVGNGVGGIAGGASHSVERRACHSHVVCLYGEDARRGRQKILVDDKRSGSA